MRRDPEFFEDRELELVYIAKRLRDALRLEKALTGAGIDYAVQTEKYLGGMIFRSERVGAFFYVDPAAAEPARKAVSSAGMQPHVEAAG
jgi:hypothetical protein